MIRPLILAAASGLLALPALAQATDAQISALQQAIEANGCRVTAENNAAILAAAGLAEADAATVVQALLEAGAAVIENGELVLKGENCP
jgi:protein-disulfide isomerase-like protein with CxxC motif